MTGLTCPECDADQDVDITVDTYVDTYVVTCERCGATFDIPREHRVNKREIPEWASRVNIRVGYRTYGDELDVAWTVQSAEKGNQYLDQRAVTVDVSDHPQKTYWYVALFKMLQHVESYKSARIWVKHDTVVDHLSGEASIPDDDPRARLAESIVDLCDERFYGCEFGRADRVGHDIGELLNRA